MFMDCPCPCLHVLAGHTMLLCMVHVLTVQITLNDNALHCPASYQLPNACSHVQLLKV